MRIFNNDDDGNPALQEQEAHPARPYLAGNHQDISSLGSLSRGILISIYRYIWQVRMKNSNRIHMSGDNLRLYRGFFCEMDSCQVEERMGGCGSPWSVSLWV